MNAHLLPPHLRAWHNLGLTHVLGQPQPEAQLTEALPHVRPQTAPPASPPARAARPEPEHGHARQQPPRKPAAQPAPAPPQPGWPPPWDTYLDRVRPGARVLWTYFELAQDYAQPNDARRRLWAGLLAGLDWKAGFWPVSEIRRGRLLGRADLFWRGVEHLQVPLVVCFGQRAHQVLFPGKDYVFRRATCGPVRLLTLPGPSALLTEPEALAFARASLDTLGREMGRLLG